jgi:hypothetical protein
MENSIKRIFKEFLVSLAKTNTPRKNTIKADNNDKRAKIII